MGNEYRLTRWVKQRNNLMRNQECNGSKQISQVDDIIFFTKKRTRIETLGSPASVKNFIIFLKSINVPNFPYNCTIIL